MIKRPSDDMLEHIKKYYYPLPDTGELFSRKTKQTVGLQRIREGGYMKANAKPARPFTIVDVKRRKFIKAHLMWYLCMGDWPTQHVIHLNDVYTDDRLDNLQCGTVRGNSQRYFHKRLTEIENGLEQLEQDAGKLACACPT